MNSFRSRDYLKALWLLYSLSPSLFHLGVQTYNLFFFLTTLLHFFFALFFDRSPLSLSPLSKASANVNHLSISRKCSCGFFEKFLKTYHPQQEKEAVSGVFQRDSSNSQSHEFLWVIYYDRTFGHHTRQDTIAE